MFPRRWMPLHLMITHTTIPYADALARSRQQDRICLTLCIGTVLLLILILIVLRAWSS